MTQVNRIFPRVFVVDASLILLLFRHKPKFVDVILILFRSDKSFFLFGFDAYSLMSKICMCQWSSECMCLCLCAKPKSIVFYIYYFTHDKCERAKTTGEKFAFTIKRKHKICESVFGYKRKTNKVIGRIKNKKGKQQ